MTEPRAPVPLSAEHLAVPGIQPSTVSLVSATHQRGVNALAANQTATFGPKLTVVYGPNAAGKSGYTRILKRACRSRGVEEILGNVLSGETPLKPQAIIRFNENGTEVPFEWRPDATASGALARVSVFDSHCASVYLKDKTDVAFRPFGLDVFDRLSTACGQVRTKLEAEQATLSSTASNLPTLSEGTQARALIDNLTSLTKVEAVRSLAKLSPDE